LPAFGQPLRSTPSDACAVLVLKLHEHIGLARESLLLSRVQDADHAVTRPPRARLLRCFSEAAMLWLINAAQFAHEAA
jgi:hypothetical protein